MPRRERFSGLAAIPFDCNSFKASLSVTTRLVAKMERDVASPWTRAAMFYGPAKVILPVVQQNGQTRSLVDADLE